MLNVNKNEYRLWRDSQGRLHRADGPASEGPTGSKTWFLNGLRHREGAPAVEWANGTKEWWVNDHLHRVGGPAVETPVSKEWWEHGRLIRRERDGKATGTS